MKMIGIKYLIFNSYIATIFKSEKYKEMREYIGLYRYSEYNHFHDSTINLRYFERHQSYHGRCVNK